MTINILTVCPEMFAGFEKDHVIERAVGLGMLTLRIVDIREFADGCFRKVDDSPYGGGAGMILRVQPVLDAIKAMQEMTPAGAGESRARQETAPANANTIKAGAETASADPSTIKAGMETTSADACTIKAGTESTSADPSTIKVGVETTSADACTIKAEVGTASAAISCTVALTPAGEPFSQRIADEFSRCDVLTLVCGHYEGMDHRIYSHVDRQISIGDYVLSGGEPAAMVVADSVARLLPGVLKKGSLLEESFSDGLLEYPQYTRPADYEGERVPEILLSGNHEAIRRWRREQALELTRQRRPDLLY